jgi:hypothetical protein
MRVGGDDASTTTLSDVADEAVSSPGAGTAAVRRTAAARFLRARLRADLERAGFAADGPDAADNALVGVPNITAQ